MPATPLWRPCDCVHPRMMTSQYAAADADARRSYAGSGGVRSVRWRVWWREPFCVLYSRTPMDKSDAVQPRALSLINQQSRGMAHAHTPASSLPSSPSFTLQSPLDSHNDRSTLFCCIVPPPPPPPPLLQCQSRPACSPTQTALRIQLIPSWGSASCSVVFVRRARRPSVLLSLTHDPLEPLVTLR